MEVKLRDYASIDIGVRDHFLALYLRRYPERKYAGDILAATKQGKALVQLTELGLEVEATVPGMISVGASCLWRVEVMEGSGSICWFLAESQEDEP
jgi:hypothetical protein